MFEIIFIQYNNYVKKKKKTMIILTIRIVFRFKNINILFMWTLLHKKKNNIWYLHDPYSVLILENVKKIFTKYE